eukprot:TCONS_00024901-protein
MLIPVSDFNTRAIHSTTSNFLNSCFCFIIQLNGFLKVLLDIQSLGSQPSLLPTEHQYLPKLVRILHPTTTWNDFVCGRLQSSCNVNHSYSADRTIDKNQSMQWNKKHAK